MIYIYDFVTYTTITLSIVLAIGLIVKYNKLSNLLKIVGIYLIVGASIDIVSAAKSYVVQSNLMFLHLFSLVEIVLIGHLFAIAFKELKSKYNIYYLLIPTFIFIILNSLFFQTIDEFNTNSSILISALIIGFSIHFFTLILAYEAPNYQFTVLKWFIICLFFNHSINLIVMIFSSIFHEISQESQSFIWIFRSVVIMATKIILILYFSKLLIGNRKINE